MSRLVLMVDDDRLPMSYYVKALKLEHFRVKHCLDPDAALHFAKQKGHEICVIILDIMMPPGKAYKNKATNEGLRTGTFLFGNLREYSPDAPVIILTNVRNPETLREFHGKDKVRVIQKKECPPFELVELVKSVLDEHSGKRNVR